MKLVNESLGSDSQRRYSPPLQSNSHTVKLFVFMDTITFIVRLFPSPAAGRPPRSPCAAPRRSAEREPSPNRHRFHCRNLFIHTIHATPSKLFRLCTEYLDYTINDKTAIHFSIVAILLAFSAVSVPVNEPKLARRARFRASPFAAPVLSLDISCTFVFKLLRSSCSSSL